MPSHLIFCVDATASMGAFLDALRDQVLPQVIDMARLLSGGDLKIDAVFYRDYSDRPVTQLSFNNSVDDVRALVARQRPSGGGDAPEAQKTALNSVLRALPPDEPALVIHYTDAPPHHASNAQRGAHGHFARERNYLRDATPGFDWLAICRAFQARRVPVFTFLPAGNAADFDTASFYTCLAEATDGACVVLPRSSRADAITRATIAVLLRAMSEQPDKQDACFTAQRYADSAAASAVIHDASANENSTGLLPHTSLLLPLQVDSLSNAVRALPWLGQNAGALPARLQSDAAFRNTCFDVFRQLLQPRRVMCLTYNALFGKVWRMLCRFRDDPRLPPLRDALSSCVQSLAGDERTALSDWVEASYDQSDEIAALVSSVADARPFYALDGGVQLDGITRKELLSLATAPARGVLAAVQRILTGVICVQRDDAPLPRLADSGVPMYVPCALDDADVFAMLAHLVYPGVMFTRRPAALVAVLAYLSDNATLKARAERFLAAHCGRWLLLPADHIEPGTDLYMQHLSEYPELLNVDYAKLLHRVPQFLTAKERAFFDRVWHWWRARSAARQMIDIDTGFVPRLQRTVPDYKLPCQRCARSRSFTLLQNGVCGLCLQGDCDVDEPVDVDDSTSHMVECRSCNALYAVINVNGLNVQPKCHYCREGQSAPTTRCQRCFNCFVTPDGDDDKPHFVCAVCTRQPSAAVCVNSVSLLELLAQNAELAPTAFGLSREAAALIVGDNDRVQSMSFFKIFTRHYDVAVRQNDAQMMQHSPDGAQPALQLQWRGKPVHRAAALVQTIRQVVLRGDLRDECALCFEPHPVNALLSACGSCRNRVCGACARAWWSQMRPGGVVLPTHLACPFCKQVPHAATLKRFNPAACAIVRTGRKHRGSSSSSSVTAVDWDAAVWYAWCQRCYRVAEAIPRECAGGVGVPNIVDFVCDECQSARHVPQSKPCPSCGIATLKASGCNHMTCAARECGAHWCFQCGEQFAADQIYEHLMQAHGNYGFGYAAAGANDEE